MSIPVCTPYITRNDAFMVTSTILDGQISAMAPSVDAFEKEWAKFCYRDFGVAVCNGTAALEMAVACLGLPPGSEVIMPSFTIISCAEAVINAGMVPVYVDCYPDTWTMNLQQVEAAITADTSAIMAVHIYGYMVDMKKLNQIAKAHGLLVIEDASEAHGAQRDGVRAGELSDIAVFSFYSNKIVVTGEGGMALTDAPYLNERMRSYRNLFHSPERRFLHYELGQNYRMTGMQAALGISQVWQIDKVLEMKSRIADAYYSWIDPSLALLPPRGTALTTNVYWMFALVLKGKLPADVVIGRLAKRGIESRPFFIGMHEQPALGNSMLDSDKFPVTARISRKGLYLPSGPVISKEDVEFVAKTFNEVARD